jgi:predicted SprT family Zn-dependent metalloprotease
MDKKILTPLIQREAHMIWDALCEMYPRLAQFDCPTISLNSRLWKCAGRCFQDDNKIDLGFKFFKHSKKYAQYMLDVILPHEIIHQADFDLFGDSEKICGHGEKWQKIMLEYGLKPDMYHTMEITRK